MSNKRFTVFLLQNVATPQDAIHPDKHPTAIDLDPASGVSGKFYYQSSASRQPAWVSEVSPLLQSPITSVFSASSSGLLIVEASSKYFAFTFGFGKTFLDPSKIQRQFGLRVALNRINPSQIRSMDTKTFEDMVVTKNTQASRSSDIPTFGVDISRDILRAVAGEPRDLGFAKRLAGSDALVLSTELSFKDIGQKCVDLYSAYTDNAYKADFEWIDHLTVVEDRAVLNSLDSLLEQQLRLSDTSQTHMATPEPIAWEDIDGFRIGGTRLEVYEDLNLDEYLFKLGPGRTKITIDLLRQRSVSIRYTRSGEFDGAWNVYQCLVSEQRIANQLYALIEGRWFAVSDTLVSQVDQFIGGLTPNILPISDGTIDETEPDYNKRMAKNEPDNLLLLDAKIKRPGGASTGIEFCDLLTGDGDLIHIKRKSRSSTLSHLFAQGSISATTFVSDGEYRDQLREHIERTVPQRARSKWLALIPDSATTVNKSNYSVAFVVLTKGKTSGPDWLPFFSKLNLMQHGRQLQSLGFSVTVRGLSN